MKPQLRGAITQSTVIESTTEISSLEETSPRETASTSAHRVPNNLIADYGREKKILTCVRIPSRVILADKLTLGQVSVQVLPFRFSPVSFHKCYILIFVSIAFFSEGQTGEAWDPANRAVFFVLRHRRALGRKILCPCCRLFAICCTFHVLSFI